MERSVLIRGPQEIETHDIIRGYIYGHRWGDAVEWLDPDGDGTYNWYRTTDGDITGETDTPMDSQLVMVGEILRRADHPDADGGSLNSEISVIANKGAFQHLTEAERLYIENNLSDYLESIGGDFSCAVYWGTDLVHLLFRDPSLDGVCNPGGFFRLLTKESMESHEIVNEYESSFENSGMTVGGTLASGTTTLNLNMPWISTGGLTGFYMDTSFLSEGGYFFLGPNDMGESGVARLVSILDSSSVEITGAPFDFATDDPILYKDSSIDKSLYIPVPAGTGTHTLGGGEYTTESGGKSTEILIETREGLEVSTLLETFIPIPWAIPAPYSIRNVPFTDIWQRLQNPSIPLNWSTLIYKINGVDVTEDVQITLIPGGAELLYDPPVDFEMASRVYVNIYVSASPTMGRQFAENALVGTEYVTLSGGGTSIMQAGGIVYLGPNSLGEEESQEVRAIIDDEQIIIYPTEYEYSAGDEIQYIYDDYPLELKYWFDIVDDFKPPRIYNMYPSQGMSNIDVNHWIRFEVSDEGLGIDISTLTLTVNNLVVYPTIYKYSDHWYQVLYTPPVPYYYNTTVECFVTVTDLSSQQNRAFATWSFNTGPPVTPIVMNPGPWYCAYPVHLNDDIKIDIFAREGGANWPSMVFTLDQKQYEYYSYPKIYRFK
jgi:hypothetical protein